MALNPRFDCPIWTPLHLARTFLVKHVEQKAKELAPTLNALLLHSSRRLLDVGCGHKPYQRCFASIPNLEYVGADIPWAGVKPDVIISEHTGLIDAPPDSFDIVVHFQTLEHVPNPGVFLAECFRVLKPGGFLLCTLPFFYPYHPVPHDFRRWSMDGLHKDLELAGFVQIQTEKVESEMVTLLTILQLFIAERLGYFWTKPVFLFLNLLGWLTRHGRRGNFHLHTSGTARKLPTP